MSKCSVNDGRHSQATPLPTPISHKLTWFSFPPLLTPIPFVTCSQSFLTSDEGKIVSEFEQELLQAVNQSIFEHAFRAFISQSKKLQDHGVLDSVFCRRSVLPQGGLPLPHQSSSVPQERTAFVE